MPVVHSHVVRNRANHAESVVVTVPGISTQWRRSLGITVALALILPTGLSGRALANAGAALGGRDLDGSNPTRQVVSQLVPTGRRSLTALSAQFPATPPAPAGGGGQTMFNPPGDSRAGRAGMGGEHRQDMAPTGAPPAARSRRVTRSPGRFEGFQGLGAIDNLTAMGSDDVEPPDQGLCVGAGYVVEAINTVITVYKDSDTGTRLVNPIDTNALFALPPFLRGGVFGDGMADPVCLYDPDVDRFFLVMLAYGLVPTTGELDGTTALLVAVSASSNPLGDWATFALDTTNGDVFDAGCPCRARPLPGRRLRGHG